MAPDGYVYFVRCPANGLIKIGHTGRVDPWLRFEGLLASSPVPLEVLGVIPASKEFEKSLHVAFAAWWHHNEWFEPSEPLLAFIAREIPPWRPDAVSRDLDLVNRNRKAELLREHRERYGEAGCSFDSHCPECGTFADTACSGVCLECEIRTEAASRYA